MKNQNVCTERLLEKCLLKRTFLIACPSNKEWIGMGGVDSHKMLLDTRVSTFCSGIRGSLTGPGGTLALALLAAAKDQFTKLTSFIDRFYQELTEVAKFPKEPA
jgi:hypothetical protein